MALKSLSSQQMAHITGGWLDASRMRSKVETLPRVAALLPDLKRAHEALLAEQQRDRSAEERLAEIRGRQAELDKKHDRKARGVFNVLTAYAELADDEEDAALYLRVRDQLAPEGLRFILKSYADEAGEVRFAKERLERESKAVLRALPAPGGNLMKAVNAWFRAGAELGELEDERSRLEAGEAEDRRPRGGHAAARNGWIRIVQAALTMFELEDLSEALRVELLGPLEQEIRKAEGRRASNSEAEGAPEATSEPAAEAEAAPEPAPEPPAEAEAAPEPAPGPPAEPEAAPE